MKPRKRRLQIPHYEFGFNADTFTLISETTLDGERLTRERDETQRPRHAAEAAQATLFALASSNRPTRKA
jgi:hypothetical protein